MVAYFIIVYDDARPVWRRCGEDEPQHGSLIEFTSSNPNRAKATEFIINYVVIKTNTQTPQLQVIAMKQGKIFCRGARHKIIKRPPILLVAVYFIVCYMELPIQNRPW